MMLEQNKSKLLTACYYCIFDSFYVIFLIIIVNIVVILFPVNTMIASLRLTHVEHLKVFSIVFSGPVSLQSENSID